MYNLAFMYNIPIIHPLEFLFIVQKVAIVYAFNKMARFALEGPSELNRSRHNFYVSEFLG